MSRPSYRGFPALLMAAALASMAPAALMAAERTAPSKVEAIPGSALKRVTLTPAAANRIAIETKPVREESVKRWLLVDGEVEAVPSQSPSLPAQESAAGAAIKPVRVRVPRLDDPAAIARQTIVVLSLGEDDDDDDESEKDDDANDDDTEDGSKILVLTIDDTSRAASVSTAPLDEAFAGQARYFEVSSSDHSLTPGQRVQVKLAQPDSGKLEKVIPYSAVIYDLHGGAWVYGSPEPLVFVRQPIVVEYVHKDVAVLKEGPPPGTVVVSVGAAVLMGIEQRPAR